MRTLLVMVLLLAGCGTIDSNPTTTTPPKPVPCTSTDTYAAYGAGFFATNCRTCHEHTDQFASQNEVAQVAATIRAQISSGAMPQNAQLSGTEKTRVLAWLACGAP